MSRSFPFFQGDLEKIQKAYAVPAKTPGRTDMAPNAPTFSRTLRWLPAAFGLLCLLLAAACTSTDSVPSSSGTGIPQGTPAQAGALGIAAGGPSYATELPVGGKFQYDDNNRKQIVSLSLRNDKVRTSYLYYYNDKQNPETLRHDPTPGTKMLLVGVTFDLVGIHGEGSRTRFMTPLASSFELWERGTLYRPLDPHTLDNPLHYYIKDEGSLYLDKWIDKDQPGAGILVYEVPLSFTAQGCLVRFCPVNDPTWSSRGISPRSPDSWDCAGQGVAWRLR
jgi:hypothetical protein